MTKKTDRVTSEILEMAEDMRAGGLMTDEESKKIKTRLACTKNQKAKTDHLVKEKEEDIEQFTAEELEAMAKRGESKSDWAKAEALTFEEIETAIDLEEEGGIVD